MKVPYWRLSGFYGLYFALIGCIMPFWGLYLQHQSFTAADIGLLLALFSSVRIFAPNLWAFISHFSKSFITPLQLMRLGGILMLLCFAGIYWATKFWHYALIMLSYGFFWSAILPQYETLTLNHIKDNLEAYSSIRLWGSIGFILMVSSLGWLFDVISIQHLPMIMLALMLAIAINGLVMPAADSSIHIGQNDTENDHPRDQRLEQKRVLSIGLISFLMINVLLQITHGPYYVFFSIYLQQLDYANWMIGLLWSLGVFAEIVIFWKITFFTSRWTLRELVVLSLFLTLIRWLLTAYFADITLLLVLSQCLHAFSFGLLHVVSVKYVALFFPAKFQLQGQALYSALGFGLGGAIGAYLAGIAWSIGAFYVFSTAAVVAFMALVIALYGLPRENNLG